MAEDRVAPSESPPGDNGGNPTEFAALRRLLVGPEQHRLDELATELRERQVTAADIAEHLPEAISLRGARDRQIGRALAPTVETALRESIRRNPREIATAIFPVLGPAIRKAIAETMSALVRSINAAVEHSFTPRGIRWRLESWRTGVPYAQIVIMHSLVYRVEQAFLIHAETGLLLCHATAPELKVPDADLISGMLTAIQDFVRDSFRPGQGGTLRTFSVGEHTVQLEAGPQALLALVIKGEAPESVLRRQQDALETVHVQFGGPLAEFSGDAAPFAPAHVLLEECLETVVETGPAMSRAGLMRWVIPLALFVALILVLAGRARVRFNRAVAALDAEPGMVVVSASRAWGTWRINGLRDPMARTPDAVLAGIDMIPRTLSGRWDAYLSLDSAIVLGRARAAHALGPGAVLSLRGDTLVVSGPLPVTSLPSLRRTGAVAGVSAVELSSALLTLPPLLDSLRVAIQGERALFDPGSAELTVVEATRARAVAARFRALGDSVSGLGGVVGVLLVGRTDPTGTNEANQALAQWRVDRVAAIFAAAGVPVSRLRQEAVATARPLSSSDPVEQARINRSVSFEVTVSAGPVSTRGQ